MAKATLYWGCSIHVQASYSLNGRELVMKPSVGTSGQVSIIIGSRSAISSTKEPVDM